MKQKNVFMRPNLFTDCRMCVEMFFGSRPPECDESENKTIDLRSMQLNTMAHFRFSLLELHSK